MSKMREWVDNFIETEIEIAEEKEKENENF